MSDWLKVRAELPAHRKVRALARELGVCEAEALGIVVTLWLWVSIHRASGELDGDALADLDDALPSRRLSRVTSHVTLRDSLVTVTLLDLRDGVYRVHDWHDHGGSGIAERDTSRQKARDRQHRKRLRDKGLTSCGDPDCHACHARHADPVTRDVTRDVTLQSRAEQSTSTPLAPQGGMRAGDSGGDPITPERAARSEAGEPLPVEACDDSFDPEAPKRRKPAPGAAAAVARELRQRWGALADRGLVAPIADWGGRTAAVRRRLGEVDGSGRCWWLEHWREALDVIETGRDPRLRGDRRLTVDEFLAGGSGGWNARSLIERATPAPKGAPPKQLDPCADCNGRGRGAICSTCDGDGRARDPDGRKLTARKCEPCRGLGAEVCGRCKGSGAEPTREAG